jgi:hypothetical protein
MFIRLQKTLGSRFAFLLGLNVEFDMFRNYEKKAKLILTKYRLIKLQNLQAV